MSENSQLPPPQDVIAEIDAVRADAARRINELRIEQSKVLSEYRKCLTAARIASITSNLNATN